MQLTAIVGVTLFHSGVSAKLITIAACPDFIPRIKSWTFSFAASNREGCRSSADMLAELSIKKMNRSPTSFVPCQFGRNSAIANSKISNNCSHKSKLFRSRCQIELTCKSSIDLCHKKVLGTSTGCRFSFKKYKTRIAGGTAARIVHCHHDSIGVNRCERVVSRFDIVQPQ